MKSRILFYSAYFLGLCVIHGAQAQGVSAPLNLFQPSDAVVAKPTAAISSRDLPQAPKAKSSKDEFEKSSLTVNRKTAVKDNAPNEINLPGVMRIEGKDPRAIDFSRTHVVEFTNNGNEVVYLSSRSINRFQLPFANGNIVAPEDALNVKQSGNNLYISFKEVAPAAIYIEAPNSTGVTLGLQIVPKDIQAQTVIVQDSNGVLAQQKPVKSDGFTSQIESLISTAAVGAVPAGFSNVKFTDGIVVKNGLRIEPQRLYSNTHYDIWVYQVSNPNPTQVVLNREDFDADSVQATSFYPSPIILPGKSVKAIVISNKGR